MEVAIGDGGREVGRNIADWIGERPETVIPVAALLTGEGRVWIEGDPAAPDAVLVESPLVPGEPQGLVTARRYSDFSTTPTAGAASRSAPTLPTRSSRSSHVAGALRGR